MNKFNASSLSDVVLILLINVKIPAIVGILTFMRINFVLSCVEHGESFIISGSGHLKYLKSEIFVRIYFHK